MGSLGGGEILLLFVLALLLFGPRKLPEIGRTLGKTVAEFRKATLDFKTSLEREVELDKIKQVTGTIQDVTRLTHPIQALKEAVIDAVDASKPAPAEPPRPATPPDVVPRQQS